MKFRIDVLWSFFQLLGFMNISIVHFESERVDNLYALPFHLISFSRIFIFHSGSSVALSDFFNPVLQIARGSNDVTAMTASRRPKQMSQLR
mmetsp:Transcript_1906/g.4462  ORF Transcript_1906/g.4462 Transcript_1906/m.4462 type:complete len:91 (-) Transcript_1906:1853-2125(-)